MPTVPTAEDNAPEAPPEKAPRASKRAARPPEEPAAVPGPPAPAEPPIPTDETVVSLLAKAAEMVGPIGKDDRAPESMGGFNFRGIEKIMERVGPALRSLGVVVVPKVLERFVEERPWGRDKTARLVTLVVQYSFYGPHGDVLRAVTVGEGLDPADKAANKAMTSAWKYALIQTLGIGEGQDVESHSPPPPGPVYGSKREAVAATHGTDHADAVWALVDAIKEIRPVERFDAIKAAFADRFGQPYDLTPGALPAAKAWVADQLAAGAR